MNKKPLISAEELDRIFDEGEEDIIEYLDFSTARRPGLEANKIPDKHREGIKITVGDSLIIVKITEGDSLIIMVTMLVLISYLILVLDKSLFLDLDNEENTNKKYV